MFEVGPAAWAATFRLAGLLAAAQPPPLPPPELARGLAPLAEVEALAVPGIAAGLLRSAVATAPGAPLEFALPHAVAVGPAGGGAWETPFGGATRVWRLRISAPGALSLNLGFARYRMPPGGRLHLYTPDYGTVYGPFTEEDNEDHGQLWTPILPGDEIVVQVSVPADRREEMDLELGSVNRGYRNVAEPVHADCHVNVACPAADAYRDQVRSVAMYTIGGKSGCTGTLLNNTALDRTPYFLTARHCIATEAEANSMVVYWNFESPTCSERHGGSKTQYQTGASLRASRFYSDLTLLELDDRPKSEFDLYYAGWDRGEAPPKSAVGIHHPQLAEKSISIENDTVKAAAAIPLGDLDFWSVDWDVGSVEGGSSGSALFDPGKRVIGQLSNGLGLCGSTGRLDLYGRLSQAWTGSRCEALLDVWLDPGGTGAVRLDGVEGNRPPEAIGLPDRTARLVEQSLVWNVAGGFRDPDGDPLTFTATSSAPAVATVAVSGSTATFSLAGAGTTDITVTATDSMYSQATAETTLVLTVSAASTATNLAPEAAVVLTGRRLPIGNGATSLSLAEAFRDPDGDELSYGASSATPRVVSVTVAGSGVTLTPVAAGTARISVTATDRAGAGATATQAFDVVVPNRPPTVAESLVKAASFDGFVRLTSRGASLSLARAFTDPDGDALTYSVRSSDDSVEAAVAGGALRLTPTGLGARAEITVTATDAGGSKAAACQNFTAWFVVDASFGAETYTATEGGPGARVEFTLSEPPGEALSLPLWVRTSGADASDYSGVPAALSFGPNERTRTFTVTAAADGVAEQGETLTIGLHAPLPDGVDLRDNIVTTVMLRDAGGGPGPGPGPGGGGGGGGGGPPPGDDDDGDDGGGDPPPSGGGGSVDAEIATDAACADGLCRVRSGVAVEFRDMAGGFGSRLWDFGDGTLSRSAAVRHSWIEPGFYTVTLEKSGGGARSTAALTFLVEAAYPAGTCAPDAATLCQLDSRFEVTADWRTADGRTGAATVVREGTNDSGLFRFFDPDNWEVLIKVLDGCAVNGHVWVYGASTTDLGYTIAVTDTATGAVREYGNEPGQPATAIADPVAFPEGCGRQTP